MTIPPIMPPTGERMVPESASGNVFWEHVYRYRFAADFVRGRRVLDIACGEGYGTAALLAAGAASAIGVDISESAVQHAREKYAVDARIGSGDKVPLADSSIDVVVSFETIEHVPSPDAFLAECARVLVPGGRLVMSTPLRETYGTQNPNEFHVSEMTEAESVELFRRNFDYIELYAQRPHTVPSWRAGAAGDSGLRRVRKILSNFWSRAAVRAGNTPWLYDAARWRGRSVDAVNVAAGAWRPLNPYRVRRRAQFGPLGPQYLIVVATNRG